MSRACPECKSWKVRWANEFLENLLNELERDPYLQYDLEDSLRRLKAVLGVR